tara:strand:+ start:70 stop:666 length:597 start_codon:yes stop_codon:yes gene_type:complete
MTELIGIVLVTAASVTILALIGQHIEQILRKTELLLTYLSAVIILFLMVYVLLEVLMRYAFNSPLPGHLEGAELLLPMIVFFAISYTQARNGHVGMSLVVEVLPVRFQRFINIFTLGLSILTCAVLAYFGAKQAYFAYEINDVTMTPPYWPIWPSASIVPIGYGLLALRMSLQILQHIAPKRFPEPPPEDLEQPSTFR